MMGGRGNDSVMCQVGLSYNSEISFFAQLRGIIGARVPGTSPSDKKPHSRKPLSAKRIEFVDHIIF